MSKRKIDRTSLIEAGVRNLKEFGYPKVDASNILTDRIYGQFFKRMLEDNLGKGFDGLINDLLKEIDGKNRDG